MAPSNRSILKSLREIIATPGHDPKAEKVAAEYVALVEAEDAELERRVREEEEAKAAIRARIAPSPAPGGPGLGGELARSLASNAPR